MCEDDMLRQLQELITDRETFLSENRENNEIFQRDINAIKQIIHDYKVLRDVIYRSMVDKGENLDVWINENIRLRKVEILSIWKTDYNDVRCNAILYKGKRPVANITVRYDIRMIKSFIYNMYHKTKINQNFINVPFKTLIYDSFDNYIKLSKISKCSNLLREIYDNVCESETTMCYITEDEWKKDYSKRYTERDVNKLKEEVKQYGLDNVITFNDGEYKILGYGDLETKFNDNRKFSNKKERLNR